MTDLDEIDYAGSVITRALGEELRRARLTLGWSREELVERLPSDIHFRTLAAYEQGRRQCTITRLIELCCTLGVEAPMILGLVLQRAEMDMYVGLQVDLRAVLRDEREALEPLRRWAAKRLECNPGGPEVARLERGAVIEMAVLLGFARSDLVRYLQEFAPAEVDAQPK